VSVRRRIRFAILWDVTTSTGVVTLTGMSGSTSQRELAEQIARETDGMNRVVNRLNVSSAG
jgi:osmotically-inducible protein OsmY